MRPTAPQMRRALLVGAVLVPLAVAGPPARGAASRPDRSSARTPDRGVDLSEPGAGPRPERDGRPAARLRLPDVLRIEPARVSLAVTPGGRWSFGPRGGAPWLRDVGLRVTARRPGAPGAPGAGAREGGGPVRAEPTGEAAPHDGTWTLLDTRRLPVLPETTAVGLRAREGAPGGARAPLPAPDDDGDGRIDEDRLDGRDNDGDGRVDEDFGAAGDAMLVTAFTDTTRTVEVYAEHCAWRMVQVERMVGVRLVVRNLGDAELEDVRVALEIPLADDATAAVEPLRVRTAPDATGLSGAPVPGDAAGDADGALAGRRVVVRRAGRGVAVLLVAREGAAAGAGSVPGTHVVSRGEDPAGGRDASPTASTATATEATATATTSDVPALAAAPRRLRVEVRVAGRLESGASAQALAAFVALDGRGRDERALDVAARTLAGTRAACMVPPPVWVRAVRLRTLWSARTPGDPASGLVLTLPARERRASGTDGRIVWIDGLDLSLARREVRPDGTVRLEFDAPVPESIARRARTTRRARLADGRWVDLALEPEISAAARSALAWLQQPGRLDEALLAGSPNPFRDATTITWQVPREITDDTGAALPVEGFVPVSVKVYDVTGRRVATLFEGDQAPGTYTSPWTARNTMGTSVATGVYYVRLRIGQRVTTRRLVQLK